jgi:hypothetical protein
LFSAAFDKKRKGRPTDKVPSVCTVFVNEFRVYIIPVGRFVVEKPIFSLPAGEVMEGLENSYVGTVVRPVGSFVVTVDATIEVFGQVAHHLDFDSWKALLEGGRDSVAARMHWSRISFSVVGGNIY